MQFLHPTFLFGLFALAIPIILHLFHLRKAKKIYFTNVKLLKEVKQDNQTRKNLKEILVLLSRLLAMAALVFAFAQPFIPSGNEKTGRNIVSIFIDNSFSMANRKDNVPLLEAAKSRAERIVASYTDNDQFQIISQDLTPKEKRLLTKEDAINQIQKLSISPASDSLEKVTNKQMQALNKSNGNKNIYWLSDFQNGADFNIELDTTIESYAIPLAAIKKSNVSIDTCWFENPSFLQNTTNPFIIQFKNHGVEEVSSVRFSYSINGQEKPAGQFSIQPNETVNDTLLISSTQKGWNQIKLKISDAPIQFDDALNATFYVDEAINVLSIYESTPNKNTRSVFAGNENVTYKNANIKKLDYSAFAKQNLIIIEDLRSPSSGLATQLRSYLENGGNVLLFPSVGATNTQKINSFLTTMGLDEISSTLSEKKEVGYIDTKDFLFEDIYINTNENFKLPITYKSYNLTRYPQRGGIPIMRYRDGKSYLNKYKIGEGTAVLCASSLKVEQNDLIKYGAYFVPLLDKLSLSDISKYPLSLTIGNDENISFSNREGISSEKIIRLKKGDFEAIPGQRITPKKINLYPKDNIRDAGFYKVSTDAVELFQVAFNYNRNESSMDYLDSKALQAKLPFSKILDINDENEFSDIITKRNVSQQYWKWCIVICLLFLFLEMFLIRFLKR